VIKAVRAAVGPECTIMIDANNGYSAPRRRPACCACSCSPAPPPTARANAVRPLVELYGGCMVVLKIS
jgi:hypothetical protein